VWLGGYKGYTIGWTTEVTEFNSGKGKEIFLFSVTSRPTLGPTQLPIQWVPGIVFPEVKRYETEADHSPLSSAEVKEGGAISPLPHTSS
jgi:hypothetical protein